jgi:hypothetical protein
VLEDRGLDAALSGDRRHAPLPVRLRVDVPAAARAAIEAVAYFVVSGPHQRGQARRRRLGRGHRRSRRRPAAHRRRRRRPRRATLDAGAADGGGTGLRGLAQRAAAVDGTLDRGQPAGGPTRITVELPCGS